VSFQLLPIMNHPLRSFYKGLRGLRRLGRRVKNAAVGALATSTLWLLGRLSLERALRWGETTGAFLYRMLAKPRRLAHEHLQAVFGDALPEVARAHLARASFVNIGRCFCELAQIDTIRARKDEYFEVEGFEHLQAALAQGKGVVVVTGHIGNWELLAAYFAWRGVPIAAVARRIYATRLNQLLVDFRARQGVETVLRESPQSGRQIIKALKNNSVLAMLIDQDTHVPSVSVPFLGRVARTPLAAASLAIRGDLPALAVFIQRRAQGGHRITFRPPITTVVSGDRTADIRRLTSLFNAEIEAQIRRNPAEWVWWHRRWRRAPVARLDIDKDFQYKFGSTMHVAADKER
jgi:KDO2-lipid IV(A) lauroyltransferase